MLSSVGYAQTDSVPAAISPLQRFLQSGVVDTLKTGLLINDLKKDSILIAYNHNLPLIPASTMKAITVASLFKYVDMCDRYSTKVFISGTINNGVLMGNIEIIGSGDPTINSDAAPYAPDFIKEISTSLLNLGIDTIKGCIKVDTSIFPGPSTPLSWEDSNRRQYYGSGAYGFNFERNKNGHASQPSPEKVFLQKLISTLIKKGIQIEGNTNITTANRELLLTHKSAPFDEIMRSCMMRSDNLYAECLLREIGIRTKSEGSISAGIKQEFNYWENEGLNLENIAIYDGSGLSRLNRITPKFLADVLEKMQSEPYYASFFPLAGEEGTLRKFLKSTPLEGYVALKTGSMRGVQAYAGYLLDENYCPTHSIVILMNSFSDRHKAQQAAAHLLLEIFRK